MSRSLSHLRRGIAGVTFAVAFGFGATQALAAPTAIPDGSCPLNAPHNYEPCAEYCLEVFGLVDGYCDSGMCLCPNP